MTFDSKEQKAIVLEALSEYHGKGCGTANHSKLTLGQSAQLLQHVQTVTVGEVVEPKKPEPTPKED
jgi:hypothetical protein